MATESSADARHRRQSRWSEPGADGAQWAKPTTGRSARAFRSGLPRTTSTRSKRTAPAQPSATLSRPVPSEPCPGQLDEGPTRCSSARSKSNFGHAQAAAGVLGVIKMVLALEHERLPKTLHAEQPSHHIDWESSGLSLLQQARPWPRCSDRVRRAGISSFGVSGTNAHLIIEEPPLRQPSASEQAHALKLPVPLFLSGRTDQALRAQARQLSDWLSPEASWPAVVRTAALHRTHFEHRAALIIQDASRKRSRRSARCWRAYLIRRSGKG